LAGQEVQSAIPGPVQVLQEEWQTNNLITNYLMPQAYFLLLAVILRFVMAFDV
jgi:hypothetical protein